VKAILAFFLFVTTLFSAAVDCGAVPIEQFISNTLGSGVLLQQCISKPTAYVGELLYCDYYLLTTNNIAVSSAKFNTIPKFISFKAQALDISNTTSDTNINGKHYNKTLLYRYALIPHVAEEISFEPITFNLLLKVNLDSSQRITYAKECPNGSYVSQISKSTKQTKLNVMKLPTNEEQCIYIGDFDIETKVIRPANNNDIVQLLVGISGIGDLSYSFAPTFQIENRDGLKTNISDIISEDEGTANGLISKKVFVIDMLSTNERTYNLKLTPIFCFSPTTQEYYYLDADTISIFFAKNTSPFGQNSIFDIAFFSLVLSIVSIIIVAFIIYRYYSKIVVRLRNISKHNRSSNRNSTNSVFSSDTSAIYLTEALRQKERPELLITGLNDYIWERLQIVPTSNKEEVVRAMRNSGIPSEIAEKYLLLDEKNVQLADVERYINELERCIG
jgi:hypothetical protein